MTTPANINTNLSAVTVQELLDYTEFTSGLVEKLQNSFAKLDGSNINVGEFSGKLTTDASSTIKTALAGKAESTALTNLANKDGSNIDVSKFSDKLTTEASSTIKTELAKKADSTALTNLANKDGSDIDIGPISTKLESKFATADQLAEKADADLLQSYLTTTGSNMDAQFSRTLGSMFAAKDGQNIEVDAFSTRLASKFATADQLKVTAGDLANKVDKNDATTFVKLDGTNISAGEFLNKLTAEGSVIKTELNKKVDSTALTNLAHKDGSNIDVDEFSTRLASKFAKLDGTNADQGAQLLTNILNVKSSTDPNTTILAERLAKVDASAFDVGQFVRLDGTNATNAGVTTMLNKLTDKVVTTKELTAETATLAKLDGKNINVDDFANKLSDKLAIRDGSNIADGFSDALKSKFVLVDGDNIEKSGLEVKLDSKFAAISSTSGGRTAAEDDPADTLPDSWANLI